MDCEEENEDNDGKVFTWEVTVDAAVRGLGSKASLTYGADGCLTDDCMEPDFSEE